MKPIARRAPAVAALLAQGSAATPSASAAMRSRTAASRSALHATAPRAANVVPICGTGPPPEAPSPPRSHAATTQDRPGGRAVLDSRLDARIVRRRRQAEMLRQALDIRAAGAQAAVRQKQPQAGAEVTRKRFWKDVSVEEVNGAYQVHLDARPLRRPDNKEIIRLPLTKPYLAHALAVEWDHLTSARDATRQHLVPLTSLICRALDVADDDDNASSSHSDPAPLRASIAKTLLRYLDTDSLLCWAPPVDGKEGPSLRDLQEAAARPTVEFLTARVWPGTELRPVLDEAGSIVPRGQKAGVREVVHAWMLGLAAWELAGLERAVLASKSLLAAARLVVEWSEHAIGVRGTEAHGEKFGVEQAAKAASVEVDWQTGRWGVVEDTHDVEQEDLRRQLGSVVLLVSDMGVDTP